MECTKMGTIFGSESSKNLAKPKFRRAGSAKQSDCAGRMPGSKGLPFGNGGFLKGVLGEFYQLCKLFIFNKIPKMDTLRIIRKY